MPNAICAAVQPVSTDKVGQSARPKQSRRWALPDESQSHPPRALSGGQGRSADDRANFGNAAMLRERARITRELHDSVSQTLYAIIVTASRALRLLEQKESEEIQHIVDDVLQLANAGQSELRAILTNIQPDPLPSGGLTTGLATLVANVRTQTGLDIRLSLADEPDVPVTIKAALILISREALHNVVKHADAARVEIGLEVDAEQMRLMIADDGRGFDPTLSRPGHFGMQSMRERAAVFGGTLELVSTQGVGTQICVRVPRDVTRRVVTPQGCGR